MDLARTAIGNSCAREISGTTVNMLVSYEHQYSNSR